MPYIQVELDAMKRVPDAARVACIPEHQMGWGLVRMWSHCWDRKVETVTEDQLVGLFATEDPARLVRALIAFDFLEANASGCFRVRGAKRYLRLGDIRAEAGRLGGLKTAALGKSLGNLLSKRAGSSMEAGTPKPPKQKRRKRAASKQTPSKAEASASVLQKQNGSNAEALTPSTEHRAPIEALEALSAFPADGALPASPPPPVQEPSPPPGTASAALRLERRETTRADQALDVFRYWVKATGRTANAKFSQDRRTKVEARLREGYTVAQLKAAIDGCAATPHNQGKNDRGTRYDDLELICRGGSNVERYGENAPRGGEAARPSCEVCGSYDTATWPHGRARCYSHQALLEAVPA